MNQQHMMPQLYLVTPPVDDGRPVLDALNAALGATPIAAVLVRLADAADAKLIGRIKPILDLVQNRGTALLLHGRPDLVAPTGADGAHIEGVDAFKAALPALKPDRIAGCGDLASRDDAMLAGEAGADYVMFGEPDADGRRPSFAAIAERVAWWAEVIEVPCVGYAQTLDEVTEIARARAEFVAVGDLVFADPRGPAQAIADISARIGAVEPIA